MYFFHLISVSRSHLNHIDKKKKGLGKRSLVMLSLTESEHLFPKGAT